MKSHPAGARALVIPARDLCADSSTRIEKLNDKARSINYGSKWLRPYHCALSTYTPLTSGRAGQFREGSTRRLQPERTLGRWR